MDDLLSIAVSNAVAATVLALAAIVVGAVYRRPALVHGLWLLVLLKLVTPPLVYLPVAWPTVAESPPEVAAVPEEPTIAPLPAEEETAAPVVVPLAGEEGPPAVEELPTVEETASPSPVVLPEPLLWPQMLRFVWGVGALVWFLMALRRLYRFRRLLRFARPAPAALQERTQRLAQALGLKRCPRVRSLPGRIAPMLWSVGGSPRLLVPAELLHSLSGEQLDTLLVHELAHLRRRDHWVRVLEFVVMGLYWWHPVVWYARRELREAEEQCCDAWVVSTLPGAGRTYASALLDTLDFLSTTQAAVPPLASGLGRIADLKRRLTMIMQGNTPRSLTWPGCLAVVALGLTCLPMLPSLYGEPPRKEDVLDQIEEVEKALEKAKEALERDKVNLTRKMNELAQAEQMEAVSKARIEAVRKARIELEKAHLGAQLANGEQKATWRIEITVSADERANRVREVIKKIQEILPDSKIHFQAASGAAPRPGKLIPPHEAAVPPTVFRYSGGKTSQDKRINDLEKKLEKVLRELHELRKQIGQHGPPPPVPVQPGPVPAGAEPPAPGPSVPPALPPEPPTAPPPAGTRPAPRFKLVPGTNAPKPSPSLDPRKNRSTNNPYYAPTVPLKPEPVDDPPAKPANPYQR